MARAAGVPCRYRAVPSTACGSIWASSSADSAGAARTAAFCSNCATLDAPISALRGRFHEHRGVRVMPTFHPAFLLRQPERKRDAWSDLKQVIAELERLGVAPPRPARG